MNCPKPISFEDLVLYWSGDLSPSEVERLDEHLMGCSSCSVESGRVAALAEAVRATIPPIVTRTLLAKLQRDGMRLEENVFSPGQRKTVVFRAGTDLLIHRLSGLDLSGARRVRVTFSVESTGEFLMDVPDVPFDVHEGVLVACQRHFAVMPPDLVIEVRAIEASGAERAAVYTIPHAFEEPPTAP